MLWVNLSVADAIHPFSNKFAMGVRIKATGELKLNDSPVIFLKVKSPFTVVLLLSAGLVKVKPAVEIISPVKNQIIRYRNESLLFNCTVTPAGRVNKTSFQWMRNEDFYEPPGKTDTPYWSSFELKKGLQPGDEGVYECIFDEGSDTVEVRLAGI